MGDPIFDLAVVGGGPAGLTAAIYARRAGKTAVVLEKNAFGGQIAWSPKVENYPGIDSISGLELADRLVGHALAQGAQLELEEIVRVEAAGSEKLLTAASGARFRARAVVVATGARPRPLGLENEQRLTGAGVSYCAVCDGAFYAGRPAAVVGGGSAALQDALYLCDICSTVTLIHRRSEFRGEAALADALRARPNARLVLGATVTALLGGTELTGLRVRRADGTEYEEAVDGLFIAVGHDPETALLRGLAPLDENGLALLDEGCACTVPGVFAAGDLRRKDVYQLTTASADGAVAALGACRWLDAR